MKKLLSLFATLLLAYAGYSQCTASFTYSITGNTVSFTNNSTTGSMVTYYWNYTPGGGSSATNPTAVFTSNGTYQICLTVIDSLNNCFDSYCDTISITSNACDANMSVTQSGGVINGSNNSTNAFSYEWFIYDSIYTQIYTTTSTNLFYQPNFNGAYTVCLYAYDAGGNFCDSTCTQINFTGITQSCNVAYSLGQSQGTIQGLNNSTGPSSYIWNVYNSSGVLVHDTNSFDLTYLTGINGMYTVCLMGYDISGNVCDSMCSSISVSGNGSTGCSAAFSVISITGNHVAFDNNSVPGPGGVSGNSGLAYWWDFGDGTSGNSMVIGQADTSHNYTSPGGYIVCLTVIDSINGCSDTYCDSIFIGSSQSCTAAMTVGTSATGITGVNYSSGASFYNWRVYDNSGNLIYTTGSTNLNYTPFASGTYTVCLFGFDVLSQVCDSTCSSITYTSNTVPCNAAFSYVDSGFGQVIFWANTYSSSWTYSWNFGDLTTGSGSSAFHVYSTPGTYYPCLTVTDSINGCTDTYCDTIVIQSTSGNNCSANFTYIDSGNTVYFQNNSTGSALSYYWSFGDGGTSTAANPTYSYNGSGTYNVCLVAYNSNCADSICYTVTVGGNTSCQAEFVWFVDSVFSSGAPNTVYIFDLSQGVGLSYSWDFGDGNTSTQQYPTHVYANVGTYQVCLTVSDSTGCSDTYCDSIEYTTRQNGFTLNILPYSHIGSVGVESYSSVELINLYPNPANDYITIELQSGDSKAINMVVTDIFGKVVQEENVNVPSGSSIRTMDVTSLAKGSYFLILNAQQGRTVKRFVIQ